MGAAEQRGRTWTGWLALALLGLVALACGAQRPDRLRIATGQRGGTFLPLGETLAVSFAKDLPGIEFTAIESPGGRASIEMIERGEADLALLSNHVVGEAELQLVAPLYQETLQVVVRRGADGKALITDPLELAGKRVSVGAAGSGTETIADAVLNHFDIGPDMIDRRNMALVDAKAALERGELDAAFIVAGMRTPAVDELLRRDDMDLLSLGEPGRVGSALDGIRLDAPFFTVTAIPEHAYGRKPEQPVGTICVHALLVVRADLDEDLVHDLTESLFTHKVDLSKQERLLSHLSERYDPALSPYPVHPGADRFYRRDEPTFFSQHIDEISFALTIGALLFSAFSALRAARRQARRSRIETHCQEARKIVAELVPQQSASVQRTRDALFAVRERTLGEMADERLDANEAFAILQAYLTAHIRELDAQLRVHADAAEP